MSEVWRGSKELFPNNREGSVWTQSYRASIQEEPNQRHQQVTKGGMKENDNGREYFLLDYRTLWNRRDTSNLSKIS